ncbi:histidinol dehydrogenase [Candidatus Micrarchaeota archaeon]|nr:histidinol dehydrogenase [Candidatus Micrarchaeota archaeon]
MSRLVKIINPRDFEKEERAGIPAEVSIRAQAIMDDVAKRGMDALSEYSEKFDNFKLDSGNVLVSASEIDSAESRLDETQKRAIDEAFERVSKVQREIAKDALRECACKVGEGSVALVPRAISRVGIYVPGGVAPLPSSLLMAGIPARAAGVKEIIVCTPPRKEGVSPAILYAAKKLGIDKIYRIGGTQAIAAMAYGIPGIMGKVDMACGPGNVYAAAAKQIAASSGLLKVDLVAGPSEVLIIAGEGARADYAAADMLAQAEHGVNSPAILLTKSGEFAEGVEAELEKQLAELPNSENAEKSLRNYGAIVVVESIAQAQEIADSYAPEHLEILGKDAQEIAKGVTNAGAVFVNTCESFADYGMSGGNHILPTGGTARFLSGLSVYEFIVRTYIEVMEGSEQEELAELAGAFGDLEGLNAHANAARLRKKGAKK